MDYQDYYGLSSLKGNYIEKPFPMKDYTIWSWSIEPENYTQTVVFLHGYLDHSALSLYLFRHLNQQNIRIIAMDLPGHGKSSGERASLEDFSLYRNSLDGLMAAWGLEYEETIFIGHSTGGSIIIDQLFQQRSIKGAVLAAPLVQFRYWDSVSTVLKWMKEPDWVLPVSKRPSSSNKTFNLKKDSDPFRIERFTLNWPVSIIRWQNNSPDDAGISSVPILILQGGKDRVVFYERNLPELLHWFPGAEIKEYPRMRHHILNDKGREKVFEDINLFLSSLE